MSKYDINNMPVIAQTEVEQETELVFAKAKSIGPLRIRGTDGHDVMIIGNHDRDWIKKCDLDKYFESGTNLNFISDGQHQMTLCHYPMMSWPHMMRAYMVFGHIHENTDADCWPLIARSERMLNAGGDINGFRPVTFREMVLNNQKYKRQTFEDKLSAERRQYGFF